MLIISPIPAFDDNYIWMFHSPDSRNVYVVDPGDAKSVQQVLDERQLNLSGILITHHHFDHTGGVKELTIGKNIPVYGPDNKNIDSITNTLQDGDTINLDGNLFNIAATPGHTLDHIVYFTETGEKGCPVLFCGDTLFAGGCGRLFEGTAEQMYASLSRLAALPGNTRVYCAHEYTQANLKFAQAVEPENRILKDYVEEVAERRSENQPTVPFTLQKELATNPFLRSNQPDVIKAACNRGAPSNAEPAEILRVIRAWKDNF
ncbi:hydroxyacylglutathione hydrolase [Endozoicomonas elysicola]|uniref:Hydroxyacylglutathione hydrolase n=1 Tax=Endozoicomonas elysicola TaxID=305900 RepID=A0A081KCC2_9GAMM|nr:hydroxyacylglutathione hydrolase [Endozoicomonas elysicola]KEI71798.1 hydroxyacylglutathione hydrolase [Endozoicomonas elysicola]